MNSVGDAFSAPFQDPSWFGKIVVQGLITIIPIIGVISLLGWMMITIDNFRAGRRELAPAGFHLGRGWPLFVVYLVWAIIISIPSIVLGFAAGASRSGGLSALANLISFVLGLALLFLAPSIIVATYHGGIGAGLNFAAVIQNAMNHTNTSLLAGVMMLVAGIIGELGIILCFVGLIFTIPYAYAIAAGVVTWFEQATAGPATFQPPPAPAAPPPAY